MRRGTLIGLFVSAALLFSVWLISPFAFFTFLIDLFSAAVVVVPATLGGRALLPLLRLPRLPARWVLVISAALGLGSFSILALLLGLIGLLHRNLWLVLLAVATVGGLLALRWQNRNESGDQPKAVATPWAWQCLWFAAAPFLVLAILGASHAPGLIWAEEGFGYDILEYHLQLPKEYIENGRITYLPHNVYANFPANMEMLYLLTMLVHNDPTNLGTTANTIHLLFAALCVFTAWAIGRDISPQAGVISGVLLSTCTWLEYLCGLAYVENGMLFFGLSALGMMLRGFTPLAPGDRKRGEGMGTVPAGILAGFAAGCKYTAVPMIVIPLAIVPLIVHRTWRAKVRHGAGFLFCTSIAFAPWLAKNWAFTGNPVFPLANGWLGAQPPGWGPEQTSQWERGHAVEEGTAASHRLAALWHNVIADHEQRFGPAILGMGLLGFFFRTRQRADWAFLLILATQVAVWIFATHLFARFAVPFLIPLTVLGARSFGDAGTGRSLAIVGLVLLGSVWDFAFAARRHVRENALGVPASAIRDGQVPGFEHLGFVNRELPAGSRVLLVGDARPFYIEPQADYVVAFNHNPLFALLHSSSSDDAIGHWLRSNEYTHVLVHWRELRRLEKTYGFSPPTTESEVLHVIHSLLHNDLKLVKSFPLPSVSSSRYIDLYEVTLKAASDR